MKKILEISKPAIGKEEINAVIAVLKSRSISQGPKVAEFEKRFSRYCNTQYAIATNNGTSALHCALHSLGINNKDEVITTPFTFVATANAILMQGANIVFSDIEESTYNLNPIKIQENITYKTKAILPVDLYGHIYDIEHIKKIAKLNNIYILEDAAQSVSAEYLNKRSGSLSDITSFSLYATKNMTAGVGGILTTNNKTLMEKCKLFRHHGQNEDSQYEYLEFGYNYRMNDMTAAIALEQLKKINLLTKKRRVHARRLADGLKEITGIILPVERKNYKHVYHQYTIRITKSFKLSRDDFAKYMISHGIMCKIYYPKPLHLYPHLIKLGYRKGDFPVAEKVSSQVISLPVHPLLTKKDIDYIIKTINNI